jgi:hypothetical protein
MDSGSPPPLILNTLAIWASLLMKESKQPFGGDSSHEGAFSKEAKLEKALEILALVVHHRATWQVYRDKATHLLAELEAELPPEVVAAAQERGKTRKLEEVVAEILEKND